MALAAIAYAGAVSSSMRSRGLEVYNTLLTKKGVKLTHIWGLNPGASGDHGKGRAFDFMVFSNEAAGHFIANYLMADAKRLGVQYIMWNHRIWNVDRDKYGVWRWVPDRGNPTENHEDHVHVSFKSATMPYVPPTTAPTKPPADTKPPASSTKWTRADVKTLQRLLLMGQDGSWGPNTDGRAMSFRAVAADSVPHTVSHVRMTQTILGLKVDGSYGPKTRAGVKARTVHFQRLLKVSADGNWGPGTDKAFVAFRKEWRGR